MGRLHLVYNENRRDLALYMRKALAKADALNPLDRSFLIVPEQLKASIERKYFMEDPTRTLLFAEILSFRRLGLRLMEIGGGLHNETLSEPMQYFILGQVLEEAGADLKAYGSALYKPSFLPFLAETMGDFLRYDISPQDLEEACLKALEEGQIRYSEKFRDLAALLKGYEKKLQALNTYPGDLLLNQVVILLETLEAKLEKVGGQWELLDFPWSGYSFLGRARFFIHGFGISRNFTPQEQRIILALARLSQSVLVSAEADFCPEREDLIDMGRSSFRAGRTLAWDLLRGDLTRAKKISPVLEESYKPYLQSFERTQDEINWVSGEVKRLIVQEQVNPSEIAIALADPSYASSMQQAIRRLDIPFYANDDLGQAEPAFLRYMTGLAAILRFGFRREYVMPYLRSPYVDLTDEEADAFENFGLSRGIFETRMWDDYKFRANWQFPGNLKEDSEDETIFAEEELAEEDDQSEGPYYKTLRDRVLLDVKELRDRFPDTGCIDSYCKILLTFLIEGKLEKKLDLRLEDLQERGLLAEAEIEVKAWNLVLDFLKSFLDLGKDREISRDHFMYFLEEALAHGIPRRIPASGNQVLIAGLNQVAQEEASYVFVLGASQDHLPAKAFPGSLLHSQDRSYMNQLMGKSLPDNDVLRVYAGRSHLYGLLHLPKAVYLSYTGAKDQASSVMSDVAETEGVSIISYKPIGLRDVALSYPKLAWSGRENFRPLEEDIDALRAYLKQEEPAFYEKDYKNLSYRLLSPKGILRLNPVLIRDFYAGGGAWSVSQLETYAACPFSFYANNVLALRERDYWRPEATSYGNLLHKYFELAQNKLIHLEGKPDRDFVRRYFDRALSEDPGLAVFWESGEAFGLRHKALEAAYQTTLYQLEELQGLHSKDDLPLLWVPSLEEWSFGPEDPRTYQLESTDGGSLIFRGRIDRVDLAQDGGGKTYVRLLDYKTGNKKVDFPKLYYGLDLQLPIYLQAYKTYNPEIVLKDAAYVPITRPSYHEKNGKKPDASLWKKTREDDLKFKNIGLDPDRLDLALKHSEKRAVDFVDAIYGGDFSARPRSTADDAGPCRYCAFRSMCRKDEGKIDVNLEPSITDLAAVIQGKKVNRYKDAFITLLEEEE